MSFSALSWFSAALIFLATLMLVPEIRFGKPVQKVEVMQQ
jgi:hypothetical protein